MTDNRNDGTDPRNLTAKIIAGCFFFREILDTGVTLHDAWEIAAPFIQPLLDSAQNLLTPETFWAHGVQQALRMSESDQIDFVARHFEEIKVQQDYFVHRLTLTSEPDRITISHTYDMLIAELRKRYPDVPFGLT